ncbi:sigma-54 dependent transcriptional regulator [Fulvivirgaceae bacterium BMA12]|uniref:Sigma-54 dependent transcriptional regulator n=1 Tax=Agaribacillus aureus TaxID=3051825 RepID=A0ABT8KZZ9_9BACT|nr:sigma-54 dependent transcriptional regulator [Fulvivirgaceae bacterium BMA12]
MSKIPGKVLIIDDDQYVAISLKMLLEEHFKTVITEKNPKKIPFLLNQSNYDVIILDMNFQQGATSGEEGLKWLRTIKQSPNTANVILITAYGDVRVAVQAIKEGALDFVTKPWQNEKLLATVIAAYKLSHEKKRVEQLESQQKIITSSIDHQFSNIIGQSEAMVSVFKTIQKVAQTNANVLILGENGTGKEMVARAIHRQSDRHQEIFIGVDMGAIAENLFESELFGHKKGAFTDAKEDRIGRFEAANRGTLFLDEIGNLSLNLQAKLLSVLQSQVVTKVGSNEAIPVDARVICATNSNIYKMVKSQTFREDLLYRINTVEITLPPLRERVDDIPLLSAHFLDNYCKKYQKPKLKIPGHVVKRLQRYRWPGNIRELQHALERAVIMCEGDTLQAEDFTFLDKESDEELKVEHYNLDNLEAWAIKNAIKKHHGNISHAAQELGLSRGALYRRMEKYDL